MTGTHTSHKSVEVSNLGKSHQSLCGRVFPPRRTTAIVDFKLRICNEARMVRLAQYCTLNMHMFLLFANITHFDDHIREAHTSTLLKRLAFSSKPVRSFLNLESHQSFIGRAYRLVEQQLCSQQANRGCVLRLEASCRYQISNQRHYNYRLSLYLVKYLGCSKLLLVLIVNVCECLILGRTFSTFKRY